MPAYYNEINPFAAQWLRELIKAGHIADGEVDERSIEDVLPSDLRGFTQCHFFAGIGGWSYALRLAEWPDNIPVWTGSCPCQPFSEAGLRKGEQDKRHLWPEFYRLIRECRPPAVFGEQVSSKEGIDWLDKVCVNLEDIHYAAAAFVLPGVSVGAPHKRNRLYFVSHPTRADSTGRIASLRRVEGEKQVESNFWWNAKGALNFDSYECLADGIPSRMAKAIAGGFGNAVIPQVAAEFIHTYMETLEVVQ